MRLIPFSRISAKTKDIIFYRIDYPRRIALFVVLASAFLFRHGLAMYWGTVPGPMIDLFVYIGVGALTAFLAVLAGHVATDKRGYRWTFYIGGTLLFALITAAGIRNYRAPTPEKIVMRAVDEANSHTDIAVDNVRKDLGTISGDLRAQIGATSGRIGELSSDVRSGNETLSDEFKTVKPFTPEQAKLTFTLWNEDLVTFPLMVQSIQEAADNSVTVDFTARNTSKTSAHKGSLFVQVCDNCKFTKEPEGFMHPKGQNEHFRTKAFDGLDAGVTFEKLTVTVMPPIEGGFKVAFTYSCDNCPPPEDKNRQEAIIVPIRGQH